MRTFCQIVILLGVTCLSGCGGGGGDERASGRITIDGSSTVFRISRAAQIAYSKDARGKGVRVLVGNHSTGGGFQRYNAGEVDLVDASRPAKPDEEAEAKRKGFDWTRFVVGYDGITVAVNRSNTFVEALSVEQLKKLFEPGSAVETWKDLDPSWPDERIILYTPDNDSGTYEFFTEAIVGEKAQRKDVQASSDDNLLVRGISGDANGLGYFGYAYYAENKGRLRAVPIRAADGEMAIEPSPETILDQAYKPLSRPLYLYVKNAAMKRPEVAAFVRFYVERIDDLSRQGGYVPPNAEIQAENLANLPGGTAGDAVE